MAHPPPGASPQIRICFDLLQMQLNTYQITIN
jgi:hypothetical protein